MRLTNKLVTTNYLKYLNSNQSELNDITEKVSAHRKFLYVSEDPATAMRAFQLRKSLSLGSTHKNNLSGADGILTESESAISAINELLKDAVEKVAQAGTGTSDESARKTVAGALRSMQTSIMNSANAKYSGDFIFGGATTDITPFTIGADGRIAYKGQSVDTGTFKAEHRYLDIGLGLRVEPDGSIAGDSAMDIAYTGTDLLGAGVDADGITNNIYNLLGDIADRLETGNMGDFDKYSKKLDQVSDDIRLQYVGVGEKSSFITYFNDRLSTRNLSDSKKQTELEVLTLEQGALLLSQAQLAYDACLQMGTKILQPSLLDYLN